MTKLLNNHGLEDRIIIKVDLLVPKLADEEQFNSWSLALTEQDAWSCSRREKELDSIAYQDRLFIQAFLKTSRSLYELGRLPIFELPRIVALSRHAQNPEKYVLNIELILIHFVPQAAYQIPIQSSIELCRWIAKNSPTPENKTKVFNTISERVIKPLHQLVPSGKSTIPILRVAYEMGIPFTHLGQGVYQVGWGSKARRLDRSICEMDSAIGSKLAQNKVSTANILRIAGLPAPVHRVITAENDAFVVAEKIGFPVVIKPTDRDRGEGVTVDICDETALKASFAHAQKVSKSNQVIVERQVPGVCHRLFIANGKLLYAVKRLPMSVVGDGIRTIKRLVADEVAMQAKKPPWSRSEIKLLDDLAVSTLQKLGLSPDSIIGEGEMASLRPIESTEWGGVDKEVTAVVHPENIEIALRAADLFGLRIAGIDIISPDISKPWHSNGAIINEVNFSPLFGGAEISRSYISKFFSDFIHGDGKIPIEVFTSEDAALEFQNEKIRLGKRCYLISNNKTIDSSGKEVVMSFRDIKQCIRALILRSDIDAISVVRLDKESLNARATA